MPTPHISGFEPMTGPGAMNLTDTRNIEEYSKIPPHARTDQPVVDVHITCQQILDEGGCTVDEFFDALNALIDKWPDADA